MPENFVSRWARLKRSSDAPRRADSQSRGPLDAVASAGTEATSGHGQDDDLIGEPFDPASLPSIETIAANTDIRGFLQGRVPAELTRAALRRAWASDPAIRDFIGIAENQWDFNDPTAMPGFGPLRASDDLRALLAYALGRHGDPAEGTETPVSAAAKPLPAEADPEAVAIDPDLRQAFDGSRSTDGIGGSLDAGWREAEATGSDGAAEAMGAPRRRSHGGALPR
jgi:hypothetical protein